VPPESRQCSSTSPFQRDRYQRARSTQTFDAVLPQTGLAGYPKGNSLQTRFLRFALAFASFLGPIWASTINASTSCVTPTQSWAPFEQSGTSLCTSMGSDQTGTASAQAAASLSLSTDGFTFSVSTYAGANSTVAAYNGARAAAAASVSDWLTTSGPLRPGIVEMIPVQLVGSHGGAGESQVNFSFGLVNGACVDLFCTGPTILAEPIELGEAFQFNASASATGQSSFFQGMGDSAANASYTFEFFEADGVTPVAVTETPEPRALILAAIGLSGLWRWKRARKSVAPSGRSAPEQSTVEAAAGPSRD
jgi:hypothetical protein